MRHLAIAPAILAVCLAVGGCHSSKAPEPAASAAASTGIEVHSGRLVLPAVKGNPGAAYFLLTNQTSAPAELVGITIKGAGDAQMHETSGGTMEMLMSLSVAAGGAQTFAPGGKHVMAFGIDPKLAPGGGTEMTLSFADGSKVTAPLMVVAAGTVMPMGEAGHDHAM